MKYAELVEEIRARFREGMNNSVGNSEYGHYMNRTIRIRCDCGKELIDCEIESYPHGYGIKVDDRPIPVWVYVHCDKCNYDWALWKLRLGLDSLREDI